MTAPATWVFLGDSIVEGVRGDRVSFVSGLEERMRQAPGYGQLRIINLAAEATTAKDDLGFLPRLREVSPDHVFIQRGALESIVRPACLASGQWPCWVPRSWRAPVAMDPRVRFSAVWWRFAKQRSLDALKQRARRALLARHGGAPLAEPEAIAEAVAATAAGVLAMGAKVTLIGLLPVDDRVFPGSTAQFDRVTLRIREVATRLGVAFVDWKAVAGPPDFAGDFLRDGFHPNPAGARRLGAALAERLLEAGA